MQQKRSPAMRNHFRREMSMRADEEQKVGKAALRGRARRPMRERRTACMMMAFGLLLGGLEFFIILHYV